MKLKSLSHFRVLMFVVVLIFVSAIQSAHAGVVLNRIQKNGAILTMNMGFVHLKGDVRFQMSFNKKEASFY